MEEQPENTENPQLSKQLENVKRSLKDLRRLIFSINPKVAFGVIAGLLFLIGVTLMAQGYIDTRSYREQIVRAIREQTGRDVTISGPVSIALLPWPTLYVPQVELRGPDSDTPVPAITIDLVTLNVAVLTVFSEHPQITSITFERPVLELVRSHDNSMHWDWMNANLLRLAVGNKDAGSSLALTVNNGKVVYYDAISEKGFAIENIQFYANIGKYPRGSGSFTYLKRNLKFTLKSKSSNDIEPLSDTATPLDFSIFTDNKNSVQLQGSMDYSASMLKIRAKLEVQIEDMLNWVGNEAELEAQSFDPLHQKTRNQLEDRIAFKVTGDWFQDGLNIDMSNMELHGLDSQGKGKVTLRWVDSQPDIVADLKFSSFHYDQWKKLVTNIIAQKSEAADNPYGHEIQDNPIPDKIRIKLNATADQLAFGTQVWQKAALSATLSEATITVNQCNVELPGEANLSLFGIVSQGSTGGLRFEGSMETAGKSLRHMLTIFDESASDLPETGFGDFYARSNIYASAEQVRLSEADVKISDLRLNGGLVAYFEARPRLEADVRLKDINFDYFRDIWRMKQKQAGKQDFFLQINQGSSFNWLKNLQTTIDLKVTVDNFTFLERQGDTASFRLFVKQNEFGIYDVLFNYPEGTTQGGFKLDVKGEQPYVDVTLNTDTLNTDYFSLDPTHHDEKPEASEKAEPEEDKALQLIPPLRRTPKKSTPKDTGIYPPTPAESIEDLPKTTDEDLVVRPDEDLTMSNGRWPTDLLDMSWMDGFNGSFDISIGKLIHGKLKVDGLKLQAKLDHDMLSFQTFNFIYWQSRCGILGGMYGGKVPGMSISFVMYGAELHDILKSMTGRDNITGKINMSGSLTTSGVNLFSWVKLASGKLVMAGNAHVIGVNMQGVVDAVKVSRTAGDVFNNVNLALVKGSTDFEMTGNINIKNGVIQTPAIELKSGPIVGEFRGEVRLVPWTMDISTLFKFPALVTTSDTIPTLTVQLAGPIAKPELRTDTASLEAFKAARITGK